MEDSLDLAEPVEPMELSDSLEEDDLQTIAEETDDAEEADATEEAVVEPEQGEESTEAPVERPIVFISHKQGFELDQSIAELLYAELSKDCDVYLDTEQLPSVRWRELIEKYIEEADFVVALITENANRSDWIAFELGSAYRRWQRTGSRPRLIPVHLEPLERYTPYIGPYLEGFQRINYNGNNSALVAAVRAGIFGSKEMRPRDWVFYGMEAFLVKDSRRDLMRAAFVDSPGLQEASASLARDKLFWIVGDAGVRNYVSLSLAVREQLSDAEAGTEAEPVRKIYEVTKTLSWSKVNSSTIHDSIIIFRDVAPSALFDEEKHTNELASLQSLLQRGNSVLITTSADSYLEIQQEMRKQDFEGGESIEVAHDFYKDAAKLFIFEKLLDFSKETGRIGPKQYQWASSLLGTPPVPGSSARLDDRRGEGHEIFLSIIKKWSPADIERFVTLHLRQVNKSSDILRLLERNADLDNEIHSWFISLDDSTRCFVMALALFSGLSREQLWEKYKAIVESLHRLDASLSLWPLGICRQRSSLYVTTEGALDFKEERFAEAVYRELARNYREYFIELMPLLKKWSVPPGRNQRRAQAISEERKRLTTEGREVRAAIARMVGKMGLNGLEELSGLINYWATDPIFQVREAVALSLEQATGEGQGAKQVFNILDQWCNDRSGTAEALYRTWAAASALGSIAAANTGRLVYVKALDRLKRLARNTWRNTRFYVSIPLKKAARKVPLSEIENLLSLVIQDGNAATRMNVAEALNEARVFNRGKTLEVLDSWLSSEDSNRRWVAMCSIVTWRKQSDAERREEIIKFLDQDPSTLAAVFVETIKHKYYKARILSLFEQLVLEMPDGARRKLIAGLAQIPFGLLDERLLARLRISDAPPLASLPVQVRSERWRQLLSTPQSFINDLREELDQKQMAVEVYTALRLLLEPEPNGCRQRLIAALADGFTQNRAGLDAVLTKLKDMAPATFEPFAVEVRGEILKRLFYAPEAFVEAVTTFLGRTETADEMRKVLERLAQPEPVGYREDILQAFASAHALHPASVKSLLTLFRLSTNRTLRLLAYEFNFRLLEGELASSNTLLAHLLGALRDAHEWEETVQILKYLAAAEPQGRRKALVRALAQAKATRPHEVDALLLHRSLQAEPGLASLQLEVKLSSLLHSAFVPKFLRQFFTPTR